MSIPMKTIPGYFNEKPGIQVGTKMEGDIRLGSDGRYIFDEQGVRFLKQMGVDWVMVGDVPEHNAKTYKAVREQLEERGLKIYRLQNIELHNMPAVTLGLPDRDRMIDRYLQYITDLGEAGIHYATYAHMGNGIWRGDARREVRGGATAGGLDLHAPNRATAFGPFDWPLSHGRVYGEDEIWENYEYFIKKVVPVAEAAGVYIGIHPETDALFLSKLYLHKDYRGRHIATQAFHFLIDLCKKRGLKKIWLTCNKHNDSSLAVYHHLGFQVTDTQEADIGNGFIMDDYIMTYVI